MLAADLDRLQALRGEFAVVEGRVRSVGERRQRTYLNFGSDWKSDLTITILKRTWQSMRDRGFSPDSLRGRRVRARGIVDDWQGPAITVTAGEMLEVLEGSPQRR